LLSRRRERLTYLRFMRTDNSANYLIYRQYC